jgi:hypothetical protein
MPDTPPTTEPLVLIAGETAGYCDPVTGVCVVPAATTPSEPGEVHSSTGKSTGLSK